MKEEERKVDSFEFVIIYIIIMTFLSLPVYRWLSIVCISLVQSQNSGDIRLVGGVCRMQGRLEVFFNGEWGTVCDDFFDYKGARVVCRQLGASSWDNAHIYTAGDGSGNIWIHKLYCSGYEENIFACSRSSVGSCNHIEDVGVWCFEAKEGDIRIVHGMAAGRLEIYHSDEWGTICDDGFDQTDAMVACRQLKLGTSSASFYTAGNGNGSIWLDDIGCGGSESEIDKCSHRGWGVHNCGHGKDVGIRCSGTYQPRQGDVRLVDGPGARDGRLEVYYSGSWGTVCDDSFGIPDARVACRQLRFSTDGSSSYTAGGGSSSQYINLDDLGCSGNEQRLESCSHAGWRNENCGHSDDVGVKCYGKCIVDGIWGDWLSWGACSSSCGIGTKHRTRLCDNPSPSSGGFYCTGTNKESQDCEVKPCPVAGHWAVWTDWTDCSRTCETGQRIRLRYCNNPVPSNGGANCTGKDKEMSSCFLRDCPVNGGWSHWLEWNQCNVTCGGGMRNRSRNCDSPEPAYNGSYCIGDLSDIQQCNDFICSSPDTGISIHDGTSLTYETLAGVAIACILGSAIVSIITMCLIERRRRRREGGKENGSCNRGESIEPRSSPNEYTSSDIATCSSAPEENYETVDRNKPKSCIYESYNAASSVFENKQFDTLQDDDLYENLKLGS